MQVLIIDNYDSFTYNLYQYVGEILSEMETVQGHQENSYQKKEYHVQVICNDELTLYQIRQKNFDRIIISPGPGDPSDKAYFGVCGEVILELGQTVSVLGVCLGMQGIGHYFGGKVRRASLPMHGKTSQIEHNGKGVFEGLPQKIEIMRYHSLVVDARSLPECLEITAKTIDADFEIMGLKHKKYPIEGIQFHPESFATEGGMNMLKNFSSMKSLG